uniref:Uncharacterized protein n=1 Tax=Meloidogyne incognita TaxID=6306 RepID=A0A914MSA2_MELIC
MVMSIVLFQIFQCLLTEGNSNFVASLRRIKKKDIQDYEAFLNVVVYHNQQLHSQPSHLPELALNIDHLYLT